jgi:superfamily II DNA or RNA helicase
MKLRDYELEWIQRIKASRSRRVLIVGPTGCGKTVVSVSLIREALQRHGRVLFLAHRVELINQAKQRLIDLGVPNVDVGTIRAGETENRSAKIQVASVQTLARREKPPADLVFIDEAHHASAVSYRKILESYPDALIFGLTATPYRLDGKPLGDLFEEIVESAKPSALIESGWIMRPRVWTVPVDERPDLSGVSMSGGDFNLGQLDKAARRRGLVGNIVDHWRRLAENRPTVCYAVSVRHGQQIRDAFKVSGVKAELLTGETKDTDRSGILKRLSSGQTQVVVNCMVLTEGWDCPEARCAIVARPTMSQSLWFQMAGRVMRKHDVEPIILDHAGNALMHPIPGTDIEHSLSEAQRKPRKPGQAKEKVCGDCGSSMPLGCRVCPNCGHEFWTGDPPEEVAGDLSELKIGSVDCVDCGATFGYPGAVQLGVKRCRACFFKSKPRKIVNCSQCGTTLGKNAAFRGNTKCRKCAGCAKVIRACACGKEIHHQGKGQCLECYWSSMRHPKRKCCDCGATLQSRTAIRCNPCNGIHKRTRILKCRSCGAQVSYGSTGLCKSCSVKSRQKQPLQTGDNTSC